MADKRHQCSRFTLRRRAALKKASAPRTRRRMHISNSLGDGSTDGRGTARSGLVYYRHSSGPVNATSVRVVGTRLCNVKPHNSPLSGGVQ